MMAPDELQFWDAVFLQVLEYEYMDVAAAALNADRALLARRQSAGLSDVKAGHLLASASEPQ